MVSKIIQAAEACDQEALSVLEQLKKDQPMTIGEQTRRKIVEAAAPIFNKHGYEGNSLNGLMEATGLKKGGIYRHFSSKEELAAEAFDYTWEAAWNARLLHVDEKTNGIDKLKQLVGNFIDHRCPVPGGCAPAHLNRCLDNEVAAA